MSGGWEVGDLALCVKLDDYGEPHLPRIPVGSVLTVSTVGRFDPWNPLLLTFEGHRPDVGYCADCFRKIPPHTPDAEDRETIGLLNKQPDEVPA